MRTVIISSVYKEKFGPIRGAMAMIDVIKSVLYQTDTLVLFAKV